MSTKATRSAISIFHLAVLRAAVESVPLRTYFGSTMALREWISETTALGLIDSLQSVTELGKRVAAAVEIDRLPSCPAYLWPGDEALEAAAAAAVIDIQGVQA
ncbi:hypothetical protein [Aquimonas sp.]|uniref:hypothetical protein n=1 Tax=Aquimonas sp. TaxID=1872588 RepID=UPI0037BE935E